MAATQKKKQQEGPAPQVEARIDRMVDGDYKTKAYASVTIAGAFAVHGLRVIETDKGRFISMPQESYKKNGETVYNDTFHAVTAEARTALVDAVNDAYEQRLQERMRLRTWRPEITFFPASFQLFLRQRMPISIIWTAKNRPSPLPSRALPPDFPASWKAAISSRSSWRTIRARAKQPFLRSCSMWRSSR